MQAVSTTDEGAALSSAPRCHGLALLTVFWLGEYTDMFVDELGHSEGLPFNEMATAIYRANALAHEQPTPKPEELPWIAGNAIVFHERVWK